MLSIPKLLKLVVAVGSLGICLVLFQNFSSPAHIDALSSCITVSDCAEKSLDSKAISIREWFSRSTKPRHAQVDFDIETDFRKVLNPGTPREYSVTVRRPRLSEATVVTLSLEQGLSSGSRNSRALNCVLSRHSSRPSAYGSTVCQGFDLLALGWAEIQPDQPLIIRLVPSSSVVPFSRDSAVARHHVLIAGQKNLKIDGQGIHIQSFDESAPMISIVDSELISIENLQMTHGGRQDLYGKVVELNGTRVIEILSPTLKNWPMQIGIKGIFGVAGDPADRSRQYVADANHVLPIQDLARIDYVNGAHHLVLDPKAQSRVYNEFALRFKPNKHVVVPMARGQVRGTIEGADSILITGSLTHDISLRGLSVFRSPNKAINFFGTGRGALVENSFVGFHSGAPEDRVSSPGASLRVTGSEGDLALIGNTFEGAGDDVVAVVGSFYLVDEVSDFNLDHFQVKGVGSRFKLGESAGLFETGADHAFPKAIVQVQELLPNGKLLLKVISGSASAQDLQQRAHVILSLDRSTSRSYFADNVFRNSPSHGLTLSASNATIENNTFAYTLTGGLKVTVLSFKDHSNPRFPGRAKVGSTAGNLNVRHNRFIETAHGYGVNGLIADQLSAIQVLGLKHGPQAGAFPLFAMISVTDNQILRSGWSGIYVNRVAGLLVVRNQIEACAGHHDSIGRFKPITSCTYGMQIDSSTRFNGNMTRANQFLGSGKEVQFR